MRAEVAHWIAAALFTSAGREAGEPEFVVWAAGLAGTDEGGYEDVVAHIIANVDLGARPPTPALFHEHRRLLLRGHQPERGVHRCVCQDTGLVEVDGASDEWRPCGRCNPSGYERWKKGRFRPKFAGADPKAAEQVAALRLQLPDRDGGQW